MASLKAEKPVVQLKKEPAAPKASGTTPKAPAATAAPKKAETKSKEPRKRVTLQIHPLINKINCSYTYMEFNFLHELNFFLCECFSRQLEANRLQPRIKQNEDEECEVWSA